MLIFARELQRRADLHGWPASQRGGASGLAVTDIISNGPGQGRGGFGTVLMNLAFRTLGQSAAAGALPISMPRRRPMPPRGYYGPIGPRRTDRRGRAIAGDAAGPGRGCGPAAVGDLGAVDRRPPSKSAPRQPDDHDRGPGSGVPWGAASGSAWSRAGARVLTSLEGRGEATRRRSMEAGIADASLDAIAEAELILSIVPPGPPCRWRSGWHPFSGDPA